MMAIRKVAAEHAAGSRRKQLAEQNNNGCVSGFAPHNGFYEMGIGDVFDITQCRYTAVQSHSFAAPPAWPC